MKRAQAFIVLAVLVVFMTSCSGCRQRKGSNAPSNQNGAGNSPLEAQIDGFRIIGEGLRPEQCPGGSHLIVFNKKGPSGYYDVYTMNPDGSNPTCLTRDKPELPRRHKGSASWHPSGQYIIFKAERDEHIGGSDLASPGIGLHNDIWLMTSDGQRFWKLVDIPSKRNARDSTPVTASMHPHFSNDGKKVSWTEGVITGDGSSQWGEWVLKVADFTWDETTDTPRLENLRTLQPGRQHSYCESNDFSPDDNELLICGNLEPGQAEVGMDLYTLDINTGDLVRLTESLDYWDESGHYSPDGGTIAWLSSNGYPTDFSNRNYMEWERTEVWLMESDGQEPRQLTHFNDPGYPEYELVDGKRVIVSYVSWSSDGKVLLCSLVIYDESGSYSDRLVEVDLPE
jgi:Tol biopolymer transport system component